MSGLSLSTASGEADKFFYEDPATSGGWEAVEHNQEGINYLVSKHYLRTKDGADVFVTKCNLKVKSTPQALLNTYLNTQTNWDFASTSSFEVLENKGEAHQIVYAQHKVLSAASNKKDSVVERTWSLKPGEARVYATSVNHNSRPEKYQNYARSFVMFHGVYITEIAHGVCEFTIVYCYDFNGWVHDKFILAEKSKLAARMNKIVKSTQGAQILAVTNPLILPSTSNNSNNKSASYAEYNQIMKDNAPTWESVPVERNQSKPLYQPVKQQPTPVNPPSQSGGGPNFCPSCGTSAKGMRFCSGCGTKLF